MKVLIEIHTYPSNGNDAERQHRSMGIDDFDSPACIDVALASVARELKTLWAADQLMALSGPPA